MTVRLLWDRTVGTMIITELNTDRVDLEKWEHERDLWQS